ncbi:glycosyltransferase family 2 protein [Muricoccus radiodurans]|uniref:glycosyltransferase family 2 protein n=1 Tax=Muricoccus radiodurans TaxID=2231721 RepID=UPI003CEDA4B9
MNPSLQDRGDGVSFVVPVFDKAAHLPALCATLRAQRGDFPREYVFVDDGSRDDSLAQLRFLTAAWPSTVILTQPNGGSAAATNAGLFAATMPYVKFVDADDLLHPDCTIRLLDALRGSDAGLAFCAREEFRPGETPVTDAPVPATTPERLDDALPRVLRNSLFNPTQILVRTALAQEVGGCDRRVVHSQEYGLALRMAHRAPFIRLAERLCFHLVDQPDTLSTRRDKQLARVTLAVSCFLADHPDLAASIVRLAQRRAASRAFRFRRRNPDGRSIAPHLWRAIRARWPMRDPAGFVRLCAASIAELPVPPKDLI